MGVSQKELAANFSTEQVVHDEALEKSGALLFPTHNGPLCKRAENPIHTQKRRLTSRRFLMPAVYRDIDETDTISCGHGDPAGAVLYLLS